MRFWDSSALVPLIVYEASTEQMKELLLDDRDVVVSFITPLEVESAIWRRVRGSNIDAQIAAKRRLSALVAEWTVFDDVASTLAEATRVVKRYGLRSLDAVQLAAALLVRGVESPSIVTTDEELITAASAEGFRILP